MTTTRPTQLPASNSEARKRAADPATPDWGSDLREPLDLDAIRARAEAFDEAWGWHEQTDDTLAGHGYHMMQMLYRLPVDGQTSDMKVSIEGMLTDVPALLAEVERLRAERDAYRKAKQENDERFVVERDEARAERDAAREALARVEALADELDTLAKTLIPCTGSGCPGCRLGAAVSRVRAALAQPATDEGAGA